MRIKWIKGRLETETKKRNHLALFLVNVDPGVGGGGKMVICLIDKNKLGQLP